MINLLESEGYNIQNSLEGWNSNDIVESNYPPSFANLVRTLARFKDEISNSVIQKRPNLFCSYMLEVATCFNSFYRDCKVLFDGEINVDYLAVSEATRHILRNGSHALGVIPLEEM